jgi:hypothetical protein
MAHHQPKWRASRGAPLSPAHPFTALRGFFLPPDIAAAAFNLHPAAARRDRSIAVNLNTDCSAPGDKIDTVLATAPRKTAASRATGANNYPDCSTPTWSAPGARVANA